MKLNAAARITEARSLTAAKIAQELPKGVKPSSTSGSHEVDAVLKQLGVKSFYGGQSRDVIPGLDKTGRAELLKALTKAGAKLAYKSGADRAFSVGNVLVVFSAKNIYVKRNA